MRPDDRNLWSPSSAIAWDTSGTTGFTLGPLVSDSTTSPPLFTVAFGPLASGGTLQLDTTYYLRIVPLGADGTCARPASAPVMLTYQPPSTATLGRPPAGCITPRASPSAGPHQYASHRLPAPDRAECNAAVLLPGSGGSHRGDAARRHDQRPGRCRHRRVWRAHRCRAGGLPQPTDRRRRQLLGAADVGGKHHHPEHPG